jgi:hypothetical protein
MLSIENGSGSSSDKDKSSLTLARKERLCQERLAEQPLVQAVERHFPITDSNQLQETLTKASDSLRLRYKDFVGDYYQVDKLKTIERSWQARAEKQQKQDTRAQAEAKFLSATQELLFPYLAQKYDWFGVLKDEQGKALNPERQLELPRLNLATVYDDLQNKTDVVFKMGDLTVGFDLTNERDERALWQKDLNLQSLRSGVPRADLLSTITFADPETKNAPNHGAATNVPHFIVGLDIDKNALLARRIFDKPAIQQAIERGENTAEGITRAVDDEIASLQQMVLIQLRFASEVLARIVTKKYQQTVKRNRKSFGLEYLTMAQVHAEQARKFFHDAFEKQFVYSSLVSLSEYIKQASKDGAHLAQITHTALTLMNELPEFSERIFSSAPAPVEDRELDEFFRSVLHIVGPTELRKKMAQNPDR